MMLDNSFIEAPQAAAATNKTVDARTPPQEDPLSQRMPSSDMDLVDRVLQEKGYAIARGERFGRDLPGGMVGKGGFGVVYKAKRAGSDLAVKVADNASISQSALEAEVAVLEVLDHPSIVRFVEAFTCQLADLMFIVMEYVDGGDLQSALVSRPHAFTEALARPLLFHTACALGYAHEVGIMHRDVKPENILLRGSDLLPKVADFGLARPTQHMEWAVTLAGTPMYMAPEISNPHVPYDFPADVWALGLVFANVLDESMCCSWALNQYPVDAQQTLRKRWPIGAERPKFSEAFKELQTRLINSIPGQRPTFFQLCQELQALAKEDPMPHPLWQVQTRPPSKPPEPKAVTREDAADIAGRGGYGVGCRVQVSVDGSWHPGTVRHVSTMLCPGAVQVHFIRASQPQGSRAEEAAVLVCPWEFAERLRPPASEPALPEPAFKTMVFPSRAEPTRVADISPMATAEDLAALATSSGAPSASNPSSLRLAPLAKVQCRPKDCVVQ